MKEKLSCRKQKVSGNYASEVEAASRRRKFLEILHLNLHEERKSRKHPTLKDTRCPKKFIGIMKSKLEDIGGHFGINTEKCRIIEYNGGEI